MTAHAIASKLGRRIIEVRYGDIMSKYLGQGARNICKIFDDGKAQKAVLFIDEADSLLSQRTVEATEGANEAVHAVKTELMISLNKYNGIVVFATNLIGKYDRAFETRLQYIRFTVPDEARSVHIWEVHLVEMPLARDVSAKRLAVAYPKLCGRDIGNVA
jgi:AAA+ superfamily predicted ATPase